MAEQRVGPWRVGLAHLRTAGAGSDLRGVFLQGVCGHPDSHAGRHTRRRH